MVVNDERVLFLSEHHLLSDQSKQSSSSTLRLILIYGLTPGLSPALSGYAVTRQRADVRNRIPTGPAVLKVVAGVAASVAWTHGGCLC